MTTLLLIPLDDTVVFPTMDVTLPVDVGDEDRVVLVPRHEGSFAQVGTIARVADRVRLPGGIRGASLEGVARGVLGAAQNDGRGRLLIEVEERPDAVPVDGRTRELEREYRAVVDEILDLRETALVARDEHDAVLVAHVHGQGDVHGREDDRVVEGDEEEGGHRQPLKS